MFILSDAKEVRLRYLWASLPLSFIKHIKSVFMFVFLLEMRGEIPLTKKIIDTTRQFYFAFIKI